MSIENKHVPLFLFGNGLSIALSPEFSLKTITKKFIHSLSGDKKAFLSELCGGESNLNFDDFEYNFSLIEDAYSSLKKYRKFIESDAGKLFLKKFSLANPDLSKHEIIIKALYDSYILQILSLIHGNVTILGIASKLKEFTAFLCEQLKNSPKGYVFTLNYDLLAETILLEDIGSDHITDFCSPAGNIAGTSISKYDFDPAMNENKYGSDYTTATVELWIKKQRIANYCLAKVAVQCSADTFALNQTLVLRIIIGGHCTTTLY